MRSLISTILFLIVALCSIKVFHFVTHIATVVMSVVMGTAVAVIFGLGMFYFSKNK